MPTTQPTYRILSNTHSFTFTGHQAYEKGTRAYHKVIEEFGTGVVQKNGEIHRRSLGEIVFSDPVSIVALL